MKKRTKIRVIIASAFIFGIVVGWASMSQSLKQCVADPNFHRVECCHKLTADGHCAVGQSVDVYNV